MITLTPQQAAWIRRNVWPAALQKTDQRYLAWKAQCRCTRPLTESISTSCSSGRHDRCNWDGMLALRRIPEASLCIAKGKTYWIHLAEVWEEHHAHYANCPCPCHKDQAGLFPLGAW